MVLLEVEVEVKVDRLLGGFLFSLTMLFFYLPWWCHTAAVRFLHVTQPQLAHKLTCMEGLVLHAHGVVARLVTGCVRAHSCVRETCASASSGVGCDRL